MILTGFSMLKNEVRLISDKL